MVNRSDKKKIKKKTATHNIENKHPIFQNWGEKIRKLKKWYQTRGQVGARVHCARQEAPSRCCTCLG